MAIQRWVGVFGLVIMPAQGALIAFFDYNDGFDVPDGTPQIVHGPSSGSGTLYQQRADTDGNGKVGNAFVDVPLGINVPEGKTMAWDDISKSGENDAEFFIVFSTTGFTNIVVSMDIKGNADPGITSYDLKYSLTPLVDIIDPPDVVGTIKDFSGGISTPILNNESIITNATDFARIVVDLSSVDGLEDEAYVALRFDDWKNNESMSVDNLLVTGTAVPEPGVAVLGSLALMGMGCRRRKSC